MVDTRPEVLLQVIAAVREGGPLVQCVTNHVASSLTANVLLAAGAAPAMVDIRGEAAPFATIAGALLVNVGTPHAEQQDAAVEAAEAALRAGTPWVLDPVAVGALPVRTALARKLAALRPAVVRGNASEILGLAGTGGGGRGVDSTNTVDDAVEAAGQLIEAGAGAVAISGPVDVVVTAGGITRLTGGHPLLTRVTGAGCSLGALAAACCAVGTGAVGTGAGGAGAGTAAAAASWWLSAAAEVAAEQASGPGSFAVALLDRIASIDETELLARLRLS
jgi:hydroxyethylthiazole kinase